MLYKLKQLGPSTTFVPVKPTTMKAQGRREKDMEDWLADNPHAVLPEDDHVLIISREYAFQNLVDILAVDQRGDLVVIEIKRGQTPRDVIAQALEYASDVQTWDYQRLNAQASRYFGQKGTNHGSLLSAFLETFSLEPGEFAESQFNRHQRIFIVAESIEQKIERTARWLQGRGVDIGCVRYRCYQTEEDEFFLDFEEILAGTAILAQGTPGREPRSGEVAPTEEEFVARLSESNRALYLRLKRMVETFGGDVETGATRNYLKFVAGNVFAEVHPRRDGLRLNIRPEGFNIAERESMEVGGLRVSRVSDNFLWVLNHWFAISPANDLQAVERLLRQSYDAVHGRVTGPAVGSR